MNIQKVPISQVKPWAENPRGIKTKDYERLKRQMLELGVYKPLVCVKENSHYTVLGGNMRIRALKEIGVKEVEISIVTAKTKAQKIKYALSDNDRAGFYEEQALAELVYPYLAEIKLEDFKIDLGEPYLDLKQVIERIGPNMEPGSEWQGMPEFEQNAIGALGVIVHFATAKDRKKFFKLLDQTYTDKTKSIWYPERRRGDMDQLGTKEGLVYSNES